MKTAQQSNHPLKSTIKQTLSKSNKSQFIKNSNFFEKIEDGFQRNISKRHLQQQQEQQQQPPLLWSVFLTTGQSCQSWRQPAEWALSGSRSRRHTSPLPDTLCADLWPKKVQLMCARSKKKKKKMVQAGTIHRTFPNSPFMRRKKKWHTRSPQWRTHRKWVCIENFPTL